MPQTENLIPLDDAIAALSSTRLNILMHIKKNLIHGVEKNGQWYVSRQSLDSFAASSGATAPGAICKPSCAHSKGCGGSCG